MVNFETSQFPRFFQQRLLIFNFLVDTLYSDSYNSSTNTNSPQTLHVETIPKAEEIPQEVTSVAKNESHDEQEVGRHEHFFLNFRNLILKIWCSRRPRKKKCV